MDKSYNYVAPDYRIRFGIDGKWFWFQDKSFGISGELENGDWKLEFFQICRADFSPKVIIDGIPYETLVLFRKALSIKGLGWLLDREVTLLEGDK